MKRILSLILLLATLSAFALAFTSCGEGPVHTVVMEVENYGKVTIELYEGYAPLTVQNFVSLVKKGFYDGLTFHRIINGFMIQGGDPNGDSSGDGPNTVKGEFSSNGFDNPLKHERGVISMARSNDKDSASCQFFIVHQTSDNNTQSLDGNYAAFGRVIEGMEIIDKIATVSVNMDDKPFTPVVIKSITYID